jgi:hypothetical protein
LGGEYGHYPFILEVTLAQENLSSPLKLNPEWLKMEDIVNKIKYC